MRTTGPLLVAIFLSPLLPSQTTPSIEVASIKPNRSGVEAINNHFTEQQLSWTNVPAKALIANAYHVLDYQIINAPDWLNNERWDIDAKTTGKTTTMQKFELLGPLLADRFNLQFHRDTRDMGLYRLVIAKGGIKMTEVRAGETPSHSPGIRNLPGHIEAWAMPVGALVRFLSGSHLDQPIIDGTALTGRYNFDLKWAPADNQALMPGEAADPNGPTLFHALEEQLGLKLVTTKGPVEVFVIDRIERPREN